MLGSGQIMIVSSWTDFVKRNAENAASDKRKKDEYVVNKIMEICRPVEIHALCVE